MGISDWFTGLFGGGRSSDAERKQLPPDEEAVNYAKARIEWATKVENAIDEAIEGGEIDFDELKEYTGGQLLSAIQDKKAVWSDWDTERGIREGFHRSSWAYACIWRKAKAAASVEWKAQRRTSDGWEHAPDSDLQRVIDKPNDFQTRQTLFEIITCHLNTGGNALLSKVKAGGRPVAELWPINPADIKPVMSKEEYISGYEYKNSTNTKDFDPDSVIHAMFTDPNNQFWGMSPLEAASKAVDTDNEAADYNKVALQNRAISDGVFTFNKRLSEDQYEEAKQHVREQHQGSDNARMPWVLGNEAEWQQMSMSPAEMDFIEGRKLSREEICSVFGVPPPLIGLYENATLSNIQTARRIFWEDTMIPYLRDLRSVFNLSLASEFGEDWRLTYDVSGISALMENLLKKLEIVDKLWAKGVPMSVLDDWLDLGMPDYPGKDVPYVSGNAMPASAVGATSQAPPFGDE